MTRNFPWGFTRRMERSQIHRVSVADQVAGILRQRILEGELRPGTSLPEIPLATSLGVSRNTMREAVRILSIEGLLRRNIHRGVTVAQLSLKDVQEIYHLRRMLEIPAVLAGKPGRTDVFQELRAAVDAYEEAIRSRDWAKAVSCDLQFHTLLIRFHGNRRLESFYQKVIGELRMGMVLVDRSHDNPGGLVPVHRKLYQLLVAGKRKQCAAILAQHLEDSEARLGRVMAGQGPKPGARATRAKYSRAAKLPTRADGRGNSAVAGR
ncbi:MAG TPA: GntR family transcriptional regulator [Terriglobales bacterium]|nr:GntR family transcriptional regulator [Terriglobales bacterium]